ncbi:restriction endonuclease [Sphingobium jiangsuense]|uniref:site-specific DNA-methyltransferase (adenine-specific) n=1 Tax=Sphingobium jiangsuense TaxID=870476 RepID=A0A7W6FNY4_9SPHN|nr:N-6 DNA methylase [Sphingobium jiangsuense]MBB3925318.1 adenine-specific DNA methylase [Sphingobium jiangsuense]GLS99255.1 restriction endonuclease [Sphingobium jiangsuense]
MNFIENETAQKLRGGYYTPVDLAAFIAKWVKEISPESVLEPSCGDGAFFSAFKRVRGFSKVSVTGFELDKEEAGKAAARMKECGLSNATIKNQDFLAWALRQMRAGKPLFDAVVGNPPFVRYQYLPPQFQDTAEEIFRALDLPFTKHTNAWVPFILASMAMLRPGGRLAMVVPAEIIHVTHAQSLRSYLGRECRRLVIIDPEELWFSDTLQGAVILLAEKRRSKADKAEGLGMYPVKGREFLNLSPTAVFDQPQAINGKTVQGKWTRALLDLETRSLFDELGEHEEVFRFDEVAKVDVGIVTGANKFFLVDDAVVKRYKLKKWAHPMFGRSEHCPGVIYDERQHEANVANGKPTNFLWFKESSAKIDAAARAYIKRGEEEELHKRYKCRVRSPWYTVPSVYSTEIGMLKRSHDTPRLIINRIGAYTTDTAYRIRARNVLAEKLVSSFINPLTALSAELEGRHYGGGVLELIPSEIERLTIPLPQKAQVDLTELDKAIRTLPTHQVLERQGKVLLGALGLSKAKQENVLEGWRKLRDRRHRTSSDPLPESA